MLKGELPRDRRYFCIAADGADTDSIEQATPHDRNNVAGQRLVFKRQDKIVK
jgi:hypothetical protein